MTTMRNKKINFPTRRSELNPVFNYAENTQKYIDTVAAAFETRNGESIAVFYNPYCLSNFQEPSGHFVQAKMCVNFIYDLNGLKGPSKFGKDIGFITALYAVEPEIVAPMPVPKSVSNPPSASHINAPALCKNKFPNSRLPNKDELSALFYNRDIVGILYPTIYWASTNTDTAAWDIVINQGWFELKSRNDNASILCIQRN